MKNRITVRSVLLGALVAGVFAWYDVTKAHIGHGTLHSATQIPVLPYLLLIAGVALINPLFRRLRIPVVLGSVELMIVFAMGAVSAGIANFGMGAQLVPMVAGLFNKDWNTKQARWDLHIEPFVNESFFVSEAGIRQAAREARDAELAWRRATDQLHAARMLLQARREYQRFLETARPADAASARALILERSVEHAEARWADIAGERDPGRAADELPRQVVGLADTMHAKTEALRALEAEAFEKVEIFRKGLPEPMQAIPGILPQRGENFVVYVARLKTMQRGMPLLRALKALVRSTEEGYLSPSRRADLAAALQNASDRLAALADTAELEQRKRALQEERRKAEEGVLAAKTTRNDLLAQRREADAAEHDRIDARLEETEDALARATDEAAAAQRELDRRIGPRLELAAAIRDLGEQVAVIQQELTGNRAPEPGLLAGRAKACMDGCRALGLSWRPFFVGDVPWRHWAGPLIRWALIILVTYTMLMAFNVLIYRQWAHEERLIYPLAELSLLLGSADTGDGQRRPSLYRRGMFWAGMSVSVLVIGWNLLAQHNIIPGISPIALRFMWAPYIQDSIFKGLMPHALHQIFFTVIGIAFLIPARISYSMWFFHLVYIVLGLVLVWLGFGVNLRDFESNASLVLNFHTGIGAGALMTFAGLILWKCRKYFSCAVTPATVANLAPGERRELRLASALFILCSLALILLLTFGLGANIFFSILCYVVMLLVTIGMVRAVAEGGLFVFQCWFNPFHLIRSTVGMHRTWTSVSLFAPLAIYYYVILWDIKAYVAPAMANALKIRDRLGLRRVRFHVALAVSLLVAAGVAVVTHVVIGYDRGADTMQYWFYRVAPRDALFGWIKAMAVSNPVDTSGSRYWLLTGILAMSALLFFRRKHFWLPHPLGLIVWVNPNMWCFWFSFLLGWAAKSLVNRYGNRDTYHFFRDFFVGLIVGELVMCLFGVDLNRVWMP